MQPASPQAMECAISPVQFPASAERVTFEGGPPARHGPGHHPCRNSGPKPLGTKYPGVRVKILTNFLL